MSRGGFKITRNNWDYERGERVDWLDAFARKIEDASKEPRTAVEQARARDAQDYQSLFEQITSIVSRQSGRQNAVETKVQEYQDKTGLKEYLRRMNAAKEEERKKVAQDPEIGQLPKAFSKFPPKVQEDIKNFIRNKCETHHGNIQVPALVEEVSKTFRNAGIQPQDVNDMHFEKFVSDEISKAKERNPTSDEHNVNIGLGVGIDDKDVDSANFDVFESLTPAKTSS